MAEGDQIEVSVGRTEGSLDVCKNVPSHLSAAKGETKGSQKNLQITSCRNKTHLRN